ncbi:LysR family transcriptional regulator [Fusobacterium polymorphum]|uniref:LysR family transcriptional regulator n=1 Tax=Fusobacterium nucleatum subsp. polymorphum TaxID=76857 RepID=UPI002B4BCE8A|nr:LysR family transcriptional regulator [Fusobacterium polymorphum]WRL70386.1 LysR family transcriptional regulator [Fusobacterium polymorphum]
MTERDFEILEMLNKTKNITHAADLLYINQSALSKRIVAIEQELGVTLMVRSRQGIHFTAEGEKVLHYTQEAKKQLELMKIDLKENNAVISGTLRAGISINYSQYNLPQILSEYKKKFPKVITHITTEYSRNIFLKIMNGEIDVAVVRGEFPWNENKILLEKENICLIYHNQDIGKNLSDFQYIGRKTDITFEREMAQWLRENDLKIKKEGIYVDNINTCVEMVNQGLGWAIVPEICLKNFKGQIRALVFKNGQAFTRSTYLLYTNSVSKLPQVREFIKIIQNRK